MLTAIGISATQNIDIFDIMSTPLFLHLPLILSVCFLNFLNSNYGRILQIAPLSEAVSQMSLHEHHLTGFFPVALAFSRFCISKYILTFKGASFEIQGHFPFLCQIAKPLAALSIRKLHRVRHMYSILGLQSLQYTCSQHLASSKASLSTESAVIVQACLVKGIVQRL